MKADIYDELISFFSLSRRWYCAHNVPAITTMATFDVFTIETRHEDEKREKKVNVAESVFYFLIPTAAPIKLQYFLDKIPMAGPQSLRVIISYRWI